METQNRQETLEMPDGPFRLLLGSTAVKIGERLVEARDRSLTSVNNRFKARSSV